MGNIKKFTIYEIHNKAVTALGQCVLDSDRHHSVPAMTGEHCSGIGTSGEDINSKRICHLSFIYHSELCHETKKHSINKNFNWKRKKVAHYFTLFPYLFWR